MFTARVDVSGPLAGCQQLRTEQLPWTLARALTMTAQQGQAASREVAGAVFKLRNDWTLQNIRIKAATKTMPVAEVNADTSNRQTGAPDYLSRQQSGGNRVPVNGRMHIAVPTKYLLQMVGGGVIPQELRPRQLLGAVGERYTRTKRNGQIALTNQKRVRGMVFFLYPPEPQAKMIMGRYWTERQAYPFYLLIDEARIPPRFPMEQTVMALAEKNFPQNFSKAATETIANDMLRGSGLQVKL
jgi:hypothetical protein